jgi:hypothetical protein
MITCNQSPALRSIPCRVPVDVSGEPLLPGCRVKLLQSERRKPGLEGYVQRASFTSAYVWWDGDKRETATSAGNLQLIEGA